MTPPPPGRHRAGAEPPPAADPEGPSGRDGRHRAGARHATGPRRRRWRGVLLVVTAALAAGVGPLVSGLPGSTDRSTSRISSDGAPDSRVGDDAPSPSSRPADEVLTDGTGPLPPPDRTRVPRSGPGTFRVALAAPGSGGSGVAPEIDEPADLTYTVEVEDGLPFAPRQTASTVDRVLADVRGWEPVTGLELRRATEVPDFRVLLASPGTTDMLCFPLETNGEVSCRNGDLVVLNALRWARGIPDYAGRLEQYRTYLVNHEVGHRLGYGHVTCPGPGLPAPVMQQQTYGLEGCTRNAWPDGA